MCSTSSNYPINFKLLKFYTVNNKHRQHGEPSISGCKQVIPRTLCGYYSVQTNLPGPLSSVGGMIFPSRLESTRRLPKRQACRQALCSSCWQAGHWRSHTCIILSLTSHISFHTQADRTEYYLSGEAMGILNTGPLEMFFTLRTPNRKFTGYGF